MNYDNLSGAGLGLRRDLVDHLLQNTNSAAFIELAPENWMGVGGFWGRKLRAALERYPVTCHGLSLSIGSPDPLDWEFLQCLKGFFKEIPVALYSEHLSYSRCANAHLYDLLPVPFRSDAVRHVAERIRQVQDFLGRRIAMENVSYYAPVAPEMDEARFIRAVVEEADCDLLLDVNNVYVNAFNHGYDAKQFIQALPLDRVRAIHMAGHEKKAEDLIIDTHGAPVIDPVFDLFEWTLDRVRPVPVLLERDFNFPEFAELEGELARLNRIISAKWGMKNAA